MTTIARPAAAVRPTVEHLTLARRLFDRCEALGAVTHYHGVLAIYALIRAAEAGNDERLMARAHALLQRFPDHVTHGFYNFPNYGIGGIARAYLHRIGRDDAAAEMVREHAQGIMAAPRDRDGIVNWVREPKSDMIWIDAAMAVSPFLAMAGRSFDEPRYFDEAAKQTLMMYDALRNPENGLLHQCRGFVAPGVLSQDHWGRGQGWGIFALAELVLHLPADSPHRAAVERAMLNHARALLPHQSRRGLWRQEVPLPEAWEESSGTGLIAYALGVGLRTDVLSEGEFGEPFGRAIVGLRRTCIHADGSTEMSCMGCLCPGEGDQKGTVHAYITERSAFHNEPHSFGTIMLALVEAHHRCVPPAPLLRYPPEYVDRWEQGDANRAAHGSGR